ncbi:MAG: S8 family serine peptidase [Vicinamibacterales bacterium]
MPRFVAAVLAGLMAAAVPAAAQVPPLPDRLVAAAARGPVRVIVRLATTAPPPFGAPADRLALATLQAATVRALGPNGADAVSFQTLPALAVTVDAVGLDRLHRMPAVVAIEEDRLARPALAESTALVGATTLWSQGIEGTGWSVAVLDTGVDTAHEMFVGKLVAEACFSSTVPSQQASSACPGGVSASTAPGAGSNCTLTVDGCDHGTHVAGIAVGRSASLSGVARGANLIAMQVFSLVADATLCAPARTCALSYQSDQIRGLEQVLLLAGASNANHVAAVNLSLGSGYFASACDAQNITFKQAVDNLRAVGIATIVASGNDGYSTGISAPACVSSVVAVGATTKNDAVSSFTNRSAQLALLAPGQAIRSAVPGTATYAVKDGTSMAAPHVAGAWALLKSRFPAATVTELLTALRGTGLAVQDPASGLSFPRIRIDQAAGPLGTGATTPSGVTVSVQGQSVHVVWLAPSAGDPAIGYRLEFLQASTLTVVSSLEVGDVSSYDATLPDGSYFVRVRAITGAGVGAPSAAIPFTVGIGSLAPLAPQDLRATVRDRDVTLTWNSVDQGTPATYLLEVGSSPSGSEFGVYDTGSAASSVTVRGVTPGVYYVRVRAANASGTSAASNEVRVPVGDTPGCGVSPLPPTGLSGSTSGSQVTLHWTPTAAGPPPAGYLLEAGSAAGLADLAVFSVGATTSVSTGVAPGVYYVRVRAYNACGASLPSREIIVTVP